MVVGALLGQEKLTWVISVKAEQQDSWVAYRSTEGGNWECSSCWGSPWWKTGRAREKEGLLRTGSKSPGFVVLRRLGMKVAQRVEPRTTAQTSL